MTTKEALVQVMIEAGARRAFTMPGLGITWTLDAFAARRREFDVVLARSEQIASVMAQVTGRLTGRPGVYMGQGPFTATTGAFGILEAYFAGSPMVALTDASDYDGFGQYGVYQSMTGDYGAGDIKAALVPITKYCTYATEPQDAIYGLQLAFKHASLPRSGPAAVVLKSGIVRQPVPEEPRARVYPTEGYLRYAPPRPDPDALDRLAAWLAEARLPVVIAGNGVVASGAGPALQALAERFGAAVATSYNAKGVIDETSEVAVGMLGTWGHRAANRAVATADLVIMLGASMGPDYTRFRDPQMIRPGDQRLVQIDIDSRNAGWVYPVDLAITGDASDVVSALRTRRVPGDVRDARIASIKALKDEAGYSDLPHFASSPGTVHHADITRALQGFLTADDMVTLDAGANRIWLTFGLRVRHPGQVIVPGGIGGMGWAPPAAAAVKLALPGRRVTCVAGDGGFAMTMAVVSTCVDRSLDVVFLVSNNRGLGMVRDNLGPDGTATEFGDVDFAKVGEGLGAKGIRVEAPDGLVDALNEAHRQGGPVVIDVKVDPSASHHPATDRQPGSR
jgi:acetolactate synthase-1/2/3 large subunit